MTTLLDTSTPSPQYDAYALRGRAILTAFYEKLRQGGVNLPSRPIPKLPGSGETPDVSLSFPVGILGAGQ